MTLQHLEDIREIIQARGQRASFEDLQTYLRLVRELKVRDSEVVAEYGVLLLRKFKKQLSTEEELLTTEQVATAAIDCKAFDAAFLLVTALRKRFPSSSQRTTRLVEMYFEAKGQLEKARDNYITNTLDVSPDSQYLLKRQVALEKTQDNIQGAIDLLCKYVDLFMMDREAWEELGELYLQAQMFSQAAHCYEELLLHQAHHIPYHVQYADILYTIGGSNGNNFRTARSYYAAAVQLSKGTNVRALYGLCACSAQLSGIKGSVGKDQEELGRKAAELLQKLYAARSPDKLKMVTELLKAQGLTSGASTSKAGTVLLE
ncbi:hypothetical protein WJX73_009768 [Symbiochloris irregularis]|uniref:ER membrane protein complex subunit 2 n=1 Tax=Symbiochloris irregularis TaxID=706552 RepID=A0AAW1NNY3_9CHLO